MQQNEDMATLVSLAASNPEDFKVLRRLVIKEGPTGLGDIEARSPGRGVGLAIDVETMGLDIDHDPIIELGLRRFKYDATGVITNIDRAYSWREDPGRPIPDEITRITGLRDADVAGQSIDDEEVTRLIGSASVCIAHHAAFDRPRIERRIPAINGQAWACSMAEIPWSENGFEGTKLGPLLNTCGFFHTPHRAVDDVDAVIGLLRHEFDDGRSALSVMLERAASPSWVCRAIGASFDVKDKLKARGYRWEPQGRFWWGEFNREEREREEWWLAANVYAVSANSRCMGPEWIERDWTVRHG